MVDIDTSSSEAGVVLFSDMVFIFPKVKPFSGRKMDLRPFIEQFETVYDNYPPAFKCAELFGMLEGEAANVVKGLCLDEASYETSWKSLKTRFGDPTEILFELLQQVIGLSSQ